MYLKVILGKINYKNNAYKTGELFECKKDIGLRLVKAKICKEVSEDLFKAVSKINNIDKTDDENILDIEMNEDINNKTIDDLRNELNG